MRIRLSAAIRKHTSVGQKYTKYKINNNSENFGERGKISARGAFAPGLP